MPLRSSTGRGHWSVDVVRKQSAHGLQVGLTHRRILLAGKPREAQSLTAVQALESLRHLRSGECGPVVADHDPDMSYYRQDQALANSTQETTLEERACSEERKRDRESHEVCLHSRSSS